MRARPGSFVVFILRYATAKAIHASCVYAFPVCSFGPPARLGGPLAKLNEHGTDRRPERCPSLLQPYRQHIAWFQRYDEAFAIMLEHSSRPSRNGLFKVCHTGSSQTL